MNEAEASAKDAWNPAQYERFKAQRQAPFADLLAMIDPMGVKSAVDLGCGTGELTRDLHRHLGGAQTLGLDSSAAMLAKAEAFAGAGLTFAAGKLEDWHPVRGVDLLFSNAALQWAGNHPQLLPRLLQGVAPGGQVAVQVPANDDHVSHRLASEIASEAPFSALLHGYSRKQTVLPLERYAEILHREGFTQLTVQMRVYGHAMASPRAVIEWVKGTLLTDYESRLAPEDFARFLARYSERLTSALGTGAYFYAFKRILFHGRRS